MSTLHDVWVRYCTCHISYLIHICTTSDISRGPGSGSILIVHVLQASFADVADVFARLHDCKIFITEPNRLILPSHTPAVHMDRKFTPSISNNNSFDFFDPKFDHSSDSKFVQNITYFVVAYFFNTICIFKNDLNLTMVTQFF